LKRLEEQEKAEGRLPPLLDFYKQLLKVQDGVGRKVVALNPVFSREEARARLREGKPLVDYSNLSLDWPLLRESWEQVVSLYGRYPELFGQIPAELADLSPAEAVKSTTVRAWFNGKRVNLPAAGNDRAQSLVRAMFASAVRPFLEREAEALKGLVDQEVWRRGYCPVCGGNPDLAYLERENGARWLVCGRCDTEWLFQRLQCPYCGNSDQSKLSYFADDSGAYRLYVCAECRVYLKAVDLRHMKGEAIMPLERVSTVHLDVQAREKGYQPCA